MTDLAQGQSLATIDKERRIGAALSIGMQIASRPKFAGKGYRFWHFDANCGSGWNETVGVPGSPFVFWQIAKASLRGLAPAPFFCDINLGAMHELKRRLANNTEALAHSVLLPGDNQEGIEVFAECIRRSGENPAFAVGSALIDPNGYYYRNGNGIGAPVEALTRFCREFLRIDTILNLNVRTYQMQKAQGHAVLAPREVLASLNKRHWLVGQAYRGKGARFILAIGRNTPTHDHRRLRLFTLESPEGQAIMTIAEGKRQDVLDLSGVPATPGIPGRAGDSYAPHEQPVPEMRRASDRSSPSTISTLGHVRPPIEPHAAMSRLPLLGAREE